MKVEVFSSRLVTKDNPNGKGMIDIDTSEGIEIFGGQDPVEDYKRRIRISNEIKQMAIERLEARGELNG